MEQLVRLMAVSSGDFIGSILLGLKIAIIIGLLLLNRNNKKRGISWSFSGKNKIHLAKLFQHLRFHS
jgi:hypothetical protein